MQTFSLRWRNFRSFRDTGWLNIRPITLLIGPNASGKTSILAPLLLLKQTLNSADTQLSLMTKGNLFNAGSYQDLITAHDISRELVCSLRLRRFDPKPDDEPEPVGAYPPGQFEFTFSALPFSNEPVLKSYKVWDIFGRLLIHRYRLKTGVYSLRKPKVKGLDRELRSAIRKTPPEHFLFTLEPLFRARFEAREHREPEGRELKISAEEDLYFQAIAFTASWVELLLSNISYIGPLRQRPRRLYEVAGEKPPDVGTRGELTPEVLFRQRDTDLMDSVNEWVARFEFGFHLICKQVSGDAYQIVLSRSDESPEISIADTGFGLSQILPLIVQGFYASKGGLIIAEQPEIHLNPRLQALLADLFCTIANMGKGVLVETHSEHLLLRLRRLVAENKINASDIALYYSEKIEDLSTIREVPIEENGYIPSNSWPRGFFEESLRDSLGLAFAQGE